MRSSILKFLIYCLLSVGAFYDAQSQLPELEMQRVQSSDEIKVVLDLVEKNDGVVDNGFILSLARNYYKLDQYTEAEKYYLRIIDEEICSDLDFKCLAISLLNNNKLSLANEFYNLYTQRVSDNHTFTRLWKEAIEEQNKHITGNRTPVNAYNLTYGSVNENRIAYLNLDHGTVKADVVCDDIANLTFVELPVADLNRIGTYTEGPVENSYIYSYMESSGFYALYFVENKNGKWKKSVKLELGENEAQYIHPFYKKSNYTLYYSSDKSGGFGGFDLYQIEYTGRNWIENQNLGVAVNTDKNEILPSMNNNLLSFSSNGHPGFGGYDVFILNRDLNEPKILERPYNGSANDFVLIAKSDTRALMISQLDKSSQMVNIQKQITEHKVVTGTVMNNNGQPVNNAHLLFTYDKATQGIYVLSNPDGSFKINLPDTIKTWRMEVLHPMYKSFVQNTLSSVINQQPIKLVLEAKKVEEPEQIFIVDSPSRNVIPTQPIVVKTDTVKDSSAMESNSPVVATNHIFNEIGSDTSRYYIILGSTRSYASAYEFWEKWKSKFPNAEILVYAEKGIYRIGEYAGLSHSEAMAAFRKAKVSKSDVWILRPDVK